MNKKLFTLVMAVALLLLATTLVGCAVDNQTTAAVPAADTATPAQTANPVPVPSGTETFLNNDSFDFSVLSGLVFWHGSGVGAWRTELEIYPDGTFIGSFSDSEMGIADDDYPNGTVYICEFSGKFTSPVKIGNYEYSMKCESLTLKNEPGIEEIVDGMMIITSEPVGFNDANEFYLYLPGIKFAELPEEFLSWAWVAIGEDDDELTGYGLYNVGSGAGFISYENKDDGFPDPGPGDPGDTGKPNWWGEYLGEGFALEIWLYEKTGFHFEITLQMNGSVVLSGDAAISPGNDHMAEYDGISFSLKEDFSAIDIVSSDNSEWAHLCGNYQKTE